jgi:heme A synthase
MRRAQLALAGAITVLVIVAGGVVVVRSSVVPTAAAVVDGADAAGATPGVLPTVPRQRPGAVSSPVSGPLSSPLSSPKSLDAALVAAGYRVPPGANVYAAKVTKTAGGVAYDDYQAGGGALAPNFWPASSIKVLAAVGALEFVGRQGFTGAATVRFGGGPPRTIKSIYEGAIRVSSNADYDLLVEIAGVDWLNSEFLTPAV